MAVGEDLETLGAFLARRDVEAPEPQAAEVLVLCGSAVVAAFELAARAVGDGAVERVLVTGGVGHSTPHLAEAVRRDPRFAEIATHDRTEAAVIAEILTSRLGVPEDVVWTEEESTNCGENAAYSLRLLRARHPDLHTLLLVQDPTMQRRTHASFERHRGAWPVQVRSLAPFVPRVGADGVVDPAGRTVWSLERFRSLVLGEVRRLHDDEHGYGPRGAGFIGHVDVPDDVMAAFRRLAAAYPAGR